MTNSYDFLASDLHVGHENVIPYCHRPYPDVPTMNQGIVNLWNETVPEDADVLVLGDVCMGKLVDSMPFVAKLNGAKTLMPGNHDRCAIEAQHRKGPSMEEWVLRYIDAGFADVVHDHPPITIAGQQYRVSHYPYLNTGGDSRGEDRFPERRLEDHGEWLIHGHIHDMWRQRGRMINVGLDAWGGRPVAVEEIAAIRKNGVDALDILPWV